MPKLFIMVEHIITVSKSYSQILRMTAWRVCNLFIQIITVCSIVGNWISDKYVKVFNNINIFQNIYNSELKYISNNSLTSP